MALPTPTAPTAAMASVPFSPVIVVSRKIRGSRVINVVKNMTSDRFACVANTGNATVGNHAISVLGVHSVTSEYFSIVDGRGFAANSYAYVDVYGRGVSPLIMYIFNDIGYRDFDAFRSCERLWHCRPQHRHPQSWRPSHFYIKK